MSKLVIRAKRAKRKARKPNIGKPAIAKAQHSMMWAAWRSRVHRHARWSRK